MTAAFLAAFDALPLGSFTGSYDGRQYIVTRTNFSGGAAQKLVAEERIEVDDEDLVIEGIARVIVEELQVEDRLNERVREKLVEYADQMNRSDITYSEMFKKVKREMAKQEGIVL
jgi:hypothetical protein